MSGVIWVRKNFHSPIDIGGSIIWARTEIKRFYESQRRVRVPLPIVQMASRERLTS
jgi:hypothetical protein